MSDGLLLKIPRAPLAFALGLSITCSHVRCAVVAGQVLLLECRVDVGPRVTDTGLEDVAACCPRLRRISLRCCPDLRRALAA